MELLFGLGLLAIGFVVLAHVFHSIAEDVKERRQEKRSRISYWRKTS